MQTVQRWNARTMEWETITLRSGSFRLSPPPGAGGASIGAPGETSAPVVGAGMDTHAEAVRLQRAAGLGDAGRPPAGPAARDWQPAAAGERMYHAAANDRLTVGWGSSITSADAELRHSLRRLISRCRALIRDASYAKRARNIVVNNVIGSGIGLQAAIETARGKPNEAANDAVERLHCEWMRAEFCHTGGRLHLSDMERALMAQVFDAGDGLVRLHMRRAPGSPVPLTLELIEAERLADEYVAPERNDGRRIEQGVEIDAFHRPLAYWFREAHPGDWRSSAATDRLIRVPASEVIQLGIIDRWPQTRSAPWMHTAARRLNDMEGYSEAEIVAARATSNIVGYYKTPAPDVAGEPPDGGPRVDPMQPGMMRELPPGYDVVFNNPTRPNTGMDAFMRLMLREVAAGVGVSYESLSRDYSQSNYSSSRLALLDDRDLWRVLQEWWIRAFRLPLHRAFMRAAMLSGALPAIDANRYWAEPARFEAVRFKPRGWSWIDPTKEVQAAKEAVRAGFTTVSDVIAQTAGGADLEDMVKKRTRELEIFEEAGLQLDTNPGAPASAPAQAAPPAPGQPDEDADDARPAARAQLVALRS